MGTISLQLPVSGTIVTAGLHSSNYGTLQTVINGGLDNNNFASGKIFDPTKIMQSAATTGQTLVWNGTNWAAGSASPVIARKTTAKAVNTTVAATDLLNAEVTVAAGALGTTGMVRLTAWGDMLNNSGGAAALPRFQLLLGGTTVLDTGTPGAVFGSGATRGSWRVCGEILNAGSASSQVASLFIAGGFPVAAGNDAGVSFTTGVGEYGSTTINGGTGSSANPNHLHGEGTNTGLAVNTANAAALVLNVINGVSNASYETRLLGAIVEVL